MKIKVPFWQVVVVPILLFVAGAASNQAVLIANWGKFPVMLNEAELARLQAQKADKDDDSFAVRFDYRDTSVELQKPQFDDSDQFIDRVHSIMGHNSKLKFLADYIDLGSAIYSPGDLLIELGAFCFPFMWPVWIALMLREVNSHL